jgi:hypothetical protein
LQHANLSSLFLKFSFFCLVVTGLWNVAPGVLLVFTVAGAVWASTGLGTNSVALPDWPTARHNLLDEKTWLMTAVIALPALITLVGTWGGEFPFSGDHDHHAAAAVLGAKYWQSYFVPIALTVVAMVALQNSVPQVRAWWAVIMGIATIVGAQYAKLPEYYFARYPAAFYFFSSPSILFLQGQDAGNLLNALRLTNFLAIPLVFCVLRSLLTKSPMDGGFLLFGLFYLWQKDVVYYSTSSYIDFWAGALVALAAEFIIRQDDRPWIPCLLVGLASIFKEQAIFCLPFVWMASFHSRNRYTLLSAFTFVFSVLPFSSYYWYRQSQNISRTYSLVGADKFFSGERLAEFGHRLLTQWGVSGLVLFAGVIALAIVSSWRHKGSARWWLVAGAFFPVVISYSDTISVYWTGYPRFHLITYAILGMFLIDGWAMLKTRRQKIVAIAVVATLNFIPLAPFLQDSLAIDAQRNFTEHYDSPQYYPIRALLTEALEAKTLFQGAQVFINAPTATFHKHSPAFKLGYRDLGKKFTIAMNPQSFEIPTCRCSPEFQGVMMLTPVQENLNKNKVDPQVERFKSCSEAIKQSCRSFYQQALPDGQVSGLLGVGSK